MSEWIPVHAISCGSAFYSTDSRGVRYQIDTSNHRKSFHPQDAIANVPKQDQQIYQTHAWTTPDDNNGKLVYSLPIHQDGDYRLSVMLYNHSSNHNIRILLNGVHEAVDNLSVFDEVGKNKGHVEKFEFRIQGKEFEFNGHRSLIERNNFTVEFTSPIGKNLMISALVLEWNCIGEEARHACCSCHMCHSCCDHDNDCNNSEKAHKAFLESLLL
jgi:Malectin domain